MGSALSGSGHRTVRSQGLLQNIYIIALYLEITFCFLYSDVNIAEMNASTSPLQSNETATHVKGTADVSSKIRISFSYLAFPEYLDYSSHSRYWIGWRSLILTAQSSAGSYILHENAHSPSQLFTFGHSTFFSLIFFVFLFFYGR